MKKRVRILVSLLMISGSLTLTSKSYAESRVKRAARASVLCVGIPVLGVAVGYAVRLLTIHRAGKIGGLALKQAKEYDTWAGIALIGVGLAPFCPLVLLLSVGNASEIIENPALALENNEEFRFLAEAVGTELAFSSVEQIAKGEDPETVMSSLASSLEENSNAEEEHFLDLGNEENID